MKILRICSDYFPSIGGVQSFTNGIDQVLTNKDVEVCVATTTNKNNILMDAVGKVKVKRFPVTGPLFYSKSLLDYVKENAINYDIIHVHNYHNLIPTVQIALKKYNVVFTPHYHGAAAGLFSRFLFYPYKFVLGQRLINSARILICRSHHEANLVSSHFNISLNKIRIIRGGIKYEDILRSAPFDVDKKRLLFVGRLEKYKNVQYIIRVLEHLSDDYSLWIIGSGPYEKKLRTMCNNLKLNDRIKFFRNISNEKLYRIYKSSGILLNLSELESFGLTVAECLCAGIPAIVNKKSALNEFCKYHEEVVAIDEIENYNKMADLIKSIAGKKVSSDISEYSFNNVAEKVLSVYEELV